VARLTPLPAHTLGLKGRGVIEPGARADVAAFDAQRFGETGTVQQPNRLALATGKRGGEVIHAQG
jgi:N-acyl-D-aspartate/D-glutamate deacylase